MPIEWGVVFSFWIGVFATGLIYITGYAHGRYAEAHSVAKGADE